jgi:galactokinase/mevalonate kinase-like predicted kinase
MNEEISKLEDEFTKTQGIVTWRLIGAGAGGYFLIIVEKNKQVKNGIPIKIGTCYKTIKF